jgi:hypothetical protein
MKAYVFTSGLLFAAIAVAHVFEAIARSRVFGSDVVIVLASAGLAAWAWRVGRARA